MKLKTSKKVCIQICWCYSFVNFILYASVENSDKMNGLADFHNGPDVLFLLENNNKKRIGENMLRACIRNPL
jgi:hypothetical protein